MAIENGAGAIMCNSDYTIESPQIKVSDTLDGLWMLAAAARERFGGQVVAITGSNGKTTMRAWLEQLLAPVGNTHASFASYNNHWGVPLSLSRLPQAADFGLFEVGTNHPGEIEPLSDLVRPDIALLLNVFPAHIGNFRDMEALVNEKLSIGNGLAASGMFVLPHSLKGQAKHDNLLTFGLEPDADFSGVWSDNQLVVTMPGGSHVLDVRWNDSARLSSLLASMAVLHALGVSLTEVEEVYSSLELPDGRGNQHQIAGVTVIDDSYNANPASIKMALDQLINVACEGRRIALLGEMLELGRHSEAAHAELASFAEVLDQVLTFGPSFETLGIGTHYASVSDFDLSSFVSELKPNDVILIKGSNKVFWANGFVGKLIRSLDSLDPNRNL